MNHNSAIIQIILLIILCSSPETMGQTVGGDSLNYPVQVMPHDMSLLSNDSTIQKRMEKIPAPRFIPQESSQIEFIEGPAFKYLLGAAAILGTGAAYFKAKADRKYDDYLYSHSSKDKQLTEKYDNLSAILFWSLQVNFGVLFYLLLK